MATVVLLGTLDTKGPEYAFVRDRLVAAGLDVVLVDAGVRGAEEPTGGTLGADVPAEEVAVAAGADLGALAAAGDRGA
ncbi:MAG TPA: Tm-1-like ATP-binding domain-containing protein, partial [Actinopolymorphaceae bacterium]|nr:Tm-1-like ATP-binding domain-containing protein [Actinopolymorphaceae bacterium]